MKSRVYIVFQGNHSSWGGGGGGGGGGLCAQAANLQICSQLVISCIYLIPNF